MEFPYSPVVGVARSLMAGMGLQFTIVGEENIPETGSGLIAANHTSYPDFIFAALPAVRRGRLPRFMAKQSVFSHRVTGPLMRGMKHIPVDRHAGSDSFKAAVQALRAGEIVGVFPEATMSRSFELKEFKPGATKMAQVTGAPILPTTIWGGQRIWTKEAPKQVGRKRIPVFITVGAPLVIPRGENIDEATARLKAVMQEQLDAQQAAYPELSGDQLRYLPARLGGTAPTPEEARERDEHDMTRTVDKFNKNTRPD